MKNLKKLTYNERKIVSSYGLDTEKWKRAKFVNGYLLLQNVDTGELKEIPARVKGR